MKLAPRQALLLGWSALTALALAAVLWAAHSTARLSEVRWQDEVRAASLRPQQFFLHWLELRRQVARSLVLRSQGQGWRDPYAFGLDVGAVTTDTDGEIAMQLVAVRLLQDGQAELIGRHGASDADWRALQPQAGAVRWQESWLAPLPDGRLPLLMPLATDQALIALIDMPGLFAQLRSIDWPAGMRLTLKLSHEGGPERTVVNMPGATPAHVFEVVEPTPLGQWRFVWTVEAGALGGAPMALSWSIALLGGLAVLGLSALSWQLMTRYWLQRDANRVLDARVAERTANLAQANAQLQATLHQLAQAEKLAALGRLVAGLAHQLNTPLGIITTSASAAAESLKEVAAQLESGAVKRSQLSAALTASAQGTALVLRNAERLNQLCEHFTLLAQPPEQLARHTFQLSDIVDEALARQAQRIRTAGLQVVRQVPASLQLDAYPEALLQVLAHLIDNVLLHAFPSARDDATLTVSAEDGPEVVTLTVADNGVGMDAEAQAHYFDPFFTGSMASGHSGLGGYAAHTLVQGVLGGEITVLGQPGEGTSVRLRLPKCAPARAA